MTKVKLIFNFKSRSYQQSIFANSLNKNTLVVLLTGLGKTVIALMLVVYYFNNFNGNKKILFLAPTKPLVEQQKDSFEGFFENSDDFNFQILTCLVSPKKRAELYEKNDFIFSTPQLIENDIINGIVKKEDFCLVVFDEAHRATGNYAYNFIAEEFSVKSKILALTASPAASIEGVKEVVANLRLEHVEVKKYNDPDVKPYVKNVNIDYVEVELSDEFKFVLEKLNNAYYSRCKILKDYGFFQGKQVTQLTKRDMLDLGVELRKDISSGDADEIVWKAISISAGIMKLQHGIELFESQEIEASHNYFAQFFSQSKQTTKAIEELILDIDFRDAYEALTKLKKKGVKHPKLIKFKKIIK